VKLKNRDVEAAAGGRHCVANDAFNQFQEIPDLIKWIRGN